MHMVFKVAKLMAPAVIFIDEAELMFLTDKKKLKELSMSAKDGPARIVKDFMKVPL
jgi:IQ and AAA domain-containing protein